MGAEASSLCGADFGERSDDRTNSRNGYRHRDFDTRAGSLDVAIPKLRSVRNSRTGCCSAAKRAEKALTSVVAPCSPLAGWRSSSIPLASPACPRRRCP